MVELDHPFAIGSSVDETWAAILDLDRLIPCVTGGRVIERTAPDAAKAEIKVRMGSMAMTFTGAVEVVEHDDANHHAVMRVKSREAGGQGHANATVDFRVAPEGGTIHTAAQITGKAASMGEGVVGGVLDGLITEFAAKLATI